MEMAVAKNVVTCNYPDGIYNYFFLTMQRLHNNALFAPYNKKSEIMNYDDFENGYYDDDYISPVEAFEGDEELYNEWLLNS